MKPQSPQGTPRKMKEYVIKTPSKFLCALSIFAVKLKKTLLQN